MIRYEVRRKIILTNGEVFDLSCRVYYDKGDAYYHLGDMQRSVKDKTELYIREVDCEQIHGG